MINLGKVREDQLEPAERERLIVDGQDPYRHPAYPSGNSSVARKQEADGRSVDNFAAAPKRFHSRSRTLRRLVCVPQMPWRDADDEQNARAHVGTPVTNAHLVCRHTHEKTTY